MSDAELSGRLKIQQVDPQDEPALRAWHTTYFEAETSGRPFATPPMFEEVRATAQAPPVATERVFLTGLVGDVVACVGQLVLPLKDNLNLAECVVHTAPAHRRRGYASRMLAEVEQLAAARGRTHLVTMVEHAYDLGPTGAGEPGIEFLRARGFTHSLGEVQSACPLPVPVALDDLRAEAAGHHEGYTLRSFVDRCPDDLLESLGRAVGMLITEAPSGTVEFEQEVFDEERIRSQEAVLAQAGRTSYFTVALEPGGEVVAYTQLVVPRHDPGRAYQWGTLVHPGHRGHRLGLAVKAVNLELMQAHESDLSTVLTYNAEVNDHMIAVNRRFGFTPVARSAELQKAL